MNNIRPHQGELRSQPSLKQGEGQTGGHLNATKSKPRIKNWAYYLLWVNSYMLSSFYFSLCLLILSSTYPSIKNNNNMDWGDEEGDRNISLLVSAGNLAIVVTGVFFPLLKNQSPKKVSIIAKIVLLASVLGITYPNLFTMVILRLVNGACVSILVSVGNSNAYLVSHPKHRNRTMVMFGLYGASGFALPAVISSFDDGGKFVLRLIFYAQAFVIALDVVIEVTFLKRTNAPFYIIKEGGTAEMTELLQIVFHEEDAKMVAAEHTRSLEKEKESGGKGIRQTLKVYNKEFVLVVLVGMSTTLTFYSIFYSYATVWLTFDLEDESEVSAARLVLLIISIVSVIIKVTNTVFNFIKNRRTGLIFAHITNLIGWALIWYSRISNNLIFARIGGVCIGIAIDGVLFPTYYAYMAEIAPPSLISFGYTASELVALIANFLSPYFFGNASPRKNFVYGVPVIMLIQFVNLLMIYFFFIESYGLEKSQIYNKLRGIDSQVEATENRKESNEGVPLAKNLDGLDSQGRALAEIERHVLFVRVNSTPNENLERQGKGQIEEGLEKSEKDVDIKRMVLGVLSKISIQINLNEASGFILWDIKIFLVGLGFT